MCRALLVFLLTYPVAVASAENVPPASLFASADAGIALSAPQLVPGVRVRAYTQHGSGSQREMTRGDVAAVHIGLSMVPIGAVTGTSVGAALGRDRWERIW